MGAIKLPILLPIDAETMVSHFIPKGSVILERQRGQDNIVEVFFDSVTTSNNAVDGIRTRFASLSKQLLRQPTTVATLIAHPSEVVSIGYFEPETGIVEINEQHKSQYQNWFDGSIESKQRDSLFNVMG